MWIPKPDAHLAVAGKGGACGGCSVLVSLLGVCGWDPFLCLRSTIVIRVCSVSLSVLSFRRGEGLKINSSQDNVHIYLKIQGIKQTHNPRRLTINTFVRGKRNNILFLPDIGNNSITFLPRIHPSFIFLFCIIQVAEGSPDIAMFVVR